MTMMLAAARDVEVKVGAVIFRTRSPSPINFMNNCRHRMPLQADGEVPQPRGHRGQKVWNYTLGYTVLLLLLVTRSKLCPSRSLPENFQGFVTVKGVKLM